MTALLVILSDAQSSTETLALFDLGLGQLVHLMGLQIFGLCIPDPAATAAVILLLLLLLLGQQLLS